MLTRQGMFLVAGIFVTLLADLIIANTLLALHPSVQDGTFMLLTVGAFTVITVAFAWALARQAAEHADSAEALRALAYRDPLTQVATRDVLFERLGANSGEAGALLVVDIDKFKSVNDRFGHLAGDAVIRQVADVMRGFVRGSDLVCRFGGEEFVVFLAEADLALGRAAADRLRTEVERSATRFGEHEVQVTVSIGVAHKKADCDIEAVLHCADEALYRAKNSGRNRVMLSWKDQKAAAAPREEGEVRALAS